VGFNPRICDTSGTVNHECSVYRFTVVDVVGVAGDVTLDVRGQYLIRIAIVVVRRWLRHRRVGRLWSGTRRFGDFAARLSREGPFVVQELDWPGASGATVPTAGLGCWGAWKPAPAPSRLRQLEEIVIAIAEVGANKHGAELAYQSGGRQRVGFPLVREARVERQLQAEAAAACFILNKNKQTKT
jgi:hypothetical protein